jgi:hypothetical protein
MELKKLYIFYIIAFLIASEVIKLYSFKGCNFTSKMWLITPGNSVMQGSRGNTLPQATTDQLQELVHKKAEVKSK